MKTKKIQLFLIVFFTFLFVSFVAQAQTLAGRRTSPRLMEGMRALGMGGALLAAEGTDENALFYNPAGINDFEKKLHFQFLLPTIEISSGLIGFILDDIMDGVADNVDAATTDADKLTAFDNFIAANSNRYEEMGLSGNLITVMHKYFSASLFYDNHAVLASGFSGAGTLDVESVTHVGLKVGGAYAFFDDLLQAGIAVKIAERHVIDEGLVRADVIATQSFDDTIDYRNFGLGVGADVGLKGRLPIKNSKIWDTLDPVIGVTLQDIADTRYSNGVGRNEQSLSAGIALHPSFWKLKNLFLVDFRDLDYNTNFITKMRVGLELSWPEISKILRTVYARAGLHQGYITGGLGFDFKYFKFNAATWGRETSIGSSYVKQSRLYGLQLAAGF